MILTRRTTLGGLAAFGVAFGKPVRAASRFEPSPALVDAAKRDGRIIFYTANIEELEHEMITTFNKRFPFVRVELVHLPGGQMFARLRSEIAAGKLTADVVDHSDPGLMKTLEDAFQDYAPPNAADYDPAIPVSPKLWPRLTAGWCIAWNTEVIRNPPQSWMDMTKPEYTGQNGEVSGFTGGSTWIRVMFERTVLGEDYWDKRAATKPRIYPTSAAIADGLVRGEVGVAPVIYTIIAPKKREGAPLGFIFPPEGVPVYSFAAGIPKSSQRPSAARLYLDWCLSEEGQAVLIDRLGHLTALKVIPTQTTGYDLAKVRMWSPTQADSDRLRAPWLSDWAKAYGVRQ